MIIKGLWEYDDKHGIEYIKNKNVIKDSYSRLEHFKDCIKVYQGKNKLKMSDKDIKQIEDYFEENYRENEIITRRELEKVCKV